MKKNSKIIINTICIFFVIFISAYNVSYSKAIISSLKDEKQILKQLRDYKIHTKLCDKYIDRYSVIKNIEYYDFNGNLVKDGVLVVQDALAENVVRIFEKLKERKFSIAPIKLLSGKKLVNRLPFGLFGLKKAVNDDDVNNLTGAYHCRKIQHKDKLSLHSFGTAIDINTLQNPCIFIDEKKKKVLNVVPKDGVMYLNRKIKRPNKPYGDGKIDDAIVRIFQRNGFDIWGGDWDFPIDYQHFQVSNRKFANLLMLADKKNAKKIFDLHVKCLNNNGRSLSDMAEDEKVDLEEIYERDKSKNKAIFFKRIKNICKVCINKKLSQ